MEDYKEKDPKLTPIDTLEDDAIIELVDEVDEESPPAAISPLESQLLGIPGAAAGRPAQDRHPGSPAGIHFDEQDESPAAADQPPGGASESISLEDAEWLFAEDPKKPAAGPTNAIEEISEFDEQFMDTDVPPALSAGPDAGSPDGAVEVLDIEEDELDNELLWFDDLKAEDAAPAEPPAGLAEHEDIELILPEDGELGPTSAADVFAAHLDSLFPESGAKRTPEGIQLQVPVDDEDRSTLPPVHEPPETTAAPDPAPVAPLAPPAAEPASAVGLPARIAPEELEAAVERVIERKLGGAIEEVVLRVIESAVTREIERLKKLLLEDGE